MCVYEHPMFGAPHSCQCGRHCSSDQMEKARHVIVHLICAVVSCSCVCRRWVYGDIELSEGTCMLTALSLLAALYFSSPPPPPAPPSHSAEVAKGKRRRGWFPRQCVKVCTSSPSPSSNSSSARGTSTPAQRRRKKQSSLQAE